VTYDTVNNAIRKAHYINQNGLGGAMFWELSGDKSGSESIVSVMAGSLQGGLQQKENELSYPSSSALSTRGRWQWAV
jgi:chitinase